MTKNYEAVFNEIMGYALGIVGEPNVKTKADLIAYIEDSDRRETMSGRFVRELVETTKAHAYYDKGDAVKTELKRATSARLRDESKTAKDVRPVTKANYKQWKKDPGAFDLRGIDTATHSLIRTEIKRKVKLNIDGGYSVRRRGQRYYRLESDGKRARDIITGRFVKRK